MMEKSNGKTSEEKEEDRLRKESNRRVEEALDRLSTQRKPRSKPAEGEDRAKNALDSIARMGWLRNKEDPTFTRMQNHSGVPLLRPIRKMEMEDYYSGTNKSGKHRGRKRERAEAKSVDLFAGQGQGQAQALAQDKAHGDGHINAVAPLNRPPLPQAAPPPTENAWAKKPGAALFPGSSSATVIALGVTEYNEKEMLAKAIEESLRTAEQEIVLRTEPPLPLAYMEENCYSIESVPSKPEPLTPPRDRRDTFRGYRADFHTNGRNMEHPINGTSNGSSVAVMPNSIRSHGAEEHWDCGEDGKECNIFSLESTKDSELTIYQRSPPLGENNDEQSITVFETSLNRRFEACSLQADTSLSAGSGKYEMKADAEKNATFPQSADRAPRTTRRFSSESREPLSPRSSNAKEEQFRRVRFADECSYGKAAELQSPAKSEPNENLNQEQPTSVEPTGATVPPGNLNQAEEERMFTPEHYIVMVKEDLAQSSYYQSYPTMAYGDFQAGINGFEYDGSYSSFPWDPASANFARANPDVVGGPASSTMSPQGFVVNQTMNYNFVPSGGFPSEEEVDREAGVVQSSDFNAHVDHHSRVPVNHFQNASSSGYQLRDYNPDLRDTYLLQEQCISPQPDMQHFTLGQMPSSSQQPNQPILHSQQQLNQSVLQPEQVLSLQQENIQPVLHSAKSLDFRQRNQSMLYSQEQLNQPMIHPQQQPNQSVLLSQQQSNQSMLHAQQQRNQSILLSQQQSTQSFLQPSHAANSQQHTARSKQQELSKSAFQPERAHYPMHQPADSMHDPRQVIDAQQLQSMMQPGFLDTLAQQNLQSLLQSGHGQVDKSRLSLTQNMLLGNTNTPWIDEQTLELNLLLTQQLLMTRLNKRMGNRGGANIPAFSISSPLPNVPQTTTLPDVTKPPPPLPTELDISSISPNDVYPQGAVGYGQNGSLNLQNGSNYVAQPAGRNNLPGHLGSSQGYGRGRGHSISSQN